MYNPSATNNTPPARLAVLLPPPQRAVHEEFANGTLSGKSGGWRPWLWSHTESYTLGFGAVCSLRLRQSGPSRSMRPAFDCGANQEVSAVSTSNKIGWIGAGRRCGRAMSADFLSIQCNCSRPKDPRRASEGVMEDTTGVPRS